jgi:acyl-CoA synthetase (AMP-forming)/AMP-acid ligase II
MSVTEALARRARDDADATAFTWRGRPVAWRDFHDGIEHAARRLRGAGVVPGDRVLVALGEGDAFLPVFWGALRRGAIVVPMLPRSGAGRLLEIASRLGARGIVADAEPAARWQELVSGAAAAGRFAIDGAEATRAFDDRPLQPPPSRDDVAFLQLTSGSTGEQKAVRIRHRDLEVNVEQMVEGFGVTGDDVFLSWLPLHHDMGLILMSVLPLLSGCALHLLPPGMASIRGWMIEASRRRATFTAAPDFAYRLNLRLARDHRPDVSRLRVALDAAEPVRATTVERFEEAYGLGNVITPAYGLAEATVGVTAWTPGTPIRVDERGFVALGRGFPGVRLRIAGEDGDVPSGEVGEILVASPALADGYWGETRVEGDAVRWLHTGDLGFLDGDGNLYVVGRKKEVILLGGLTLAPREIEETIDRLPFVRRSAALGIDRQRLEGEQAFVFVELARSGGDLEALSAQVVAAFHERLGFRPGRVVLLESGALPMTANGKLRYGELRRLWLEGELERSGAVLFPVADSIP